MDALYVLAALAVNLASAGPVVVPGPVCAAPNDLAISQGMYFEPTCKVITIDNSLLFATGSHELKPSAMTALARLRTQLISRRTITYVDGHTDAIGAEAANLELSLRRANAVRNALIALGIPADRLVARGFGETAPIASNSTNAGRAKNRRVELVPASTR